MVREGQSITDNTKLGATFLVNNIEENNVKGGFAKYATARLDQIYVNCSHEHEFNSLTPKKNQTNLKA